MLPFLTTPPGFVCAELQQKPRQMHNILFLIMFYFWMRKELHANSAIKSALHIIGAYCLN